MIKKQLGEGKSQLIKLSISPRRISGAEPEQTSHKKFTNTSGSPTDEENNKSKELPDIFPGNKANNNNA